MTVDAHNHVYSQGDPVVHYRMVIVGLVLSTYSVNHSVCRTVNFPFHYTLLLLGNEWQIWEPIIKWPY